MSIKFNPSNKPGAIIIEGHIQGLSNTRSLGEAGIPVYVVDITDCIAMHSRYCIKFFHCPDFILDDFADFLIGLAVSENIKDWVLLPSNDHAVYTISKHRIKLAEYYKLLAPRLDTIDTICNKLELINLAKKNNIPVPKIQLFKSEYESLSDGLEYPVITKGIYGLSFYKAIKKKALMARNNKELKEQLSFINKLYDIDRTFTQELIPDKENETISFTAFCIKGEIKTHWSGIKIREHPLKFGTATFTKSTENEICHIQSSLLLKALNYTGVCEIEYILDLRNREYKLIEMNPRTWLWVSLAKACGIDYAKIIYDYANDSIINYANTQNVQPYYWINPITDTIFSVLAILQCKLNPITYLLSLLKKNKVNAIFLKGDMRPGYKYLKYSIKFLLNR